jgi:hypothetical protein
MPERKHTGAGWKYSRSMSNNIDLALTLRYLWTLKLTRLLLVKETHVHMRYAMSFPKIGSERRR